jgi:hypothetical protein
MAQAGMFVAAESWEFALYLDVLYKMTSQGVSLQVTQLPKEKESKEDIRETERSLRKKGHLYGSVALITGLTVYRVTIGKKIYFILYIKMVEVVSPQLERLFLRLVLPISSSQAVRVLSAPENIRTNGLFIMRTSASQPNSIAVTYVIDNQIKHTLIERSGEPGEPQMYLAGGFGYQYLHQVILSINIINYLCLLNDDKTAVSTYIHKENLKNHVTPYYDSFQREHELLTEKGAFLGKRSQSSRKRKHFPKTKKGCTKRRMSWNKKTKHCNLT